MTNSPTTAEINVTPLIEVLLMLLVIFVVIAPQQFTGLPTQPPGPSHVAVEHEPWMGKLVPRAD